MKPILLILLFLLAVSGTVSLASQTRATREVLNITLANGTILTVNESLAQVQESENGTMLTITIPSANANATAEANASFPILTFPPNETLPSNETAPGGNLTLPSNETTLGDVTLLVNVTAPGNATAENATNLSQGVELPPIMVLANANRTVLAGNYFYGLGEKLYFLSIAHELFLLRRNDDTEPFIEVRMDENGNITVTLLGQNITDRNELQRILVEEDDLRLVKEILAISLEVGNLGYDGNYIPSALPLHLTAANLREWLLLNNSLSKNATDDSTVGVITSIFDTSTSRRVCARLPEGPDCRGLCGRGCTCWEFVCGDCCWHRGCYDHDNCCADDFTSFRCLFPFGFDCNEPFEC